MIEQHSIDEIPTVQGDARDLSFIPDESIHLVVTSPPYWTLICVHLARRAGAGAAGLWLNYAATVSYLRADETIRE